jgi:hypothetical protein
VLVREEAARRGAAARLLRHELRGVAGVRAADLHEGPRDGAVDVQPVVEALLHEVEDEAGRLRRLVDEELDGERPPEVSTFTTGFFFVAIAPSSPEVPVPSPTRIGARTSSRRCTRAPRS